MQVNIKRVSGVNSRQVKIIFVYFNYLPVMVRTVLLLALLCFSLSVFSLVFYSHYIFIQIIPLFTETRVRNILF